MSLIECDFDEIIQKLHAVDVLTLCRFCLGNKPKIDILSWDSVTFEPNLFCQQYLQMKLLDNERNLPSKICKSCFDELLAAYKFRERCRKADKIINSLYYNTNTSKTELKGNTDNLNKECQKEIMYLQTPKIDKILKTQDKDINFPEVHNNSDDEIDSCVNDINTDYPETHVDVRSSVCLVCNLNYDSSKELCNHFHISEKNKKRFKCTYCEKTFDQRNPLKYHEKTHTGERPHVCDICGKSYIQPNNLIIHKRNHTGEKPFVCKECGKGFTNGASLRLHMPVHTGVKNFICSICGKGMARKGELTIHMRTHTGEKPFICNICTKGFIKKSSLQAHMLSHTGEKKFVCPICGYQVAHAGKLTIHIKTHSNMKPFSCTICSRQFANKGYLKQHSKIHCGDKLKPYNCSHCGRRFMKTINLVEHMYIHTGEKPYVCNICSQCFNKSSALKNHIKLSHAENKSGPKLKEYDKKCDKNDMELTIK